MFAAYHALPDETDATLVDRWVRTGDICRFDEDGSLELLDRKEDIIVSGGPNVYSTGVEAVLGKHSLVARVAVIGVADDDWGEPVHAVVVPETDAVEEADLVAYAGTSLADYEKPKYVEFVEELPETPYGKIDKIALREPYWEDADRRSH